MDFPFTAQCPKYIIMSSVCCNFCKSSRSRLHLCNSTDERNLCFGKHKNIISLQCSWVKKVYDDSFHKWKIMSLHLVNKSFGKSYFPFQTFFQLRVSEVIPLVLLGNLPTLENTFWQSSRSTLWYFVSAFLLQQIYSN